MKINSFCHQEVQNKYMISTNFLEYYGIVGAVPKRWKKLILEYGRMHDIKNDMFSSSSFGSSSSDKLRRISLQNGFNLSDIRKFF
jgi:hypothetical protein